MRIVTVGACHPALFNRHMRSPRHMGFFVLMALKASFGGSEPLVPFTSLLLSQLPLIHSRLHGLMNTVTVVAGNVHLTVLAVFPEGMGLTVAGQTRVRQCFGIGFRAPDCCGGWGFLGPGRPPAE